MCLAAETGEAGGGLRGFSPAWSREKGQAHGLVVEADPGGSIGEHWFGLLTRSKGRSLLQLEG